jgi:hypothetical protein
MTVTTQIVMWTLVYNLMPYEQLQCSTATIVLGKALVNYHSEPVDLVQSSPNLYTYVPEWMYDRSLTNLYHFSLIIPDDKDSM